MHIFKNSKNVNYCFTILIFVTCLELPSVSRQSSILIGELGSIVEACFNVSGSPKPLLRVHKDSNDSITAISTNVTRNCVYFGPLEVSDAGNVSVTAENCFGQSNFTLQFQIIQSKLHCVVIIKSNESILVRNENL